MADYELLLRHTEGWARDKKRPLDRDLLETVIGLRSFHDVREAQEWPAGSVEHLMLVRWPSHGPAEEPDVPALIETLDTFWRFLRSTGRMRSGSAEPKELLKEAKRAGTGMREACADTNRHSSTKSLMRFAAESGMSLDGAGSVEELNERLQQVTEAFNDLPFEERARWLPDPGDRDSVPARQMTDLVNDVLGGNPYDDDGDDDVYDDEFGEDFHPETWALFPGPEDLVTQPAETDAAKEVQASRFVQQCLALARWVGDGKPVTSTGVLRLAPAREAYLELGLWDWEQRSRELAPFSAPLHAESLAAGPDAQRDATLARLRSAADAASLDRLWRACQFTGLIEVGKTKATATPAAGPGHPRGAAEWVDLGVAATTSLVLALQWVRIDPLLRTLAPFLRRGVDRVTEREVRDWWWTHPDNILGQLEQSDESRLRAFSDGEVRHLLWQVEDTGVWRREAETLHRTALGTEVAMTLAGLMDRGILEP